MESQPQNPEIRINPENFHPCFSDLCNNHAYSIVFFVYFCMSVPLSTIVYIEDLT